MWLGSSSHGSTSVLLCLGWWWIACSKISWCILLPAMVSVPPWLLCMGIWSRVALCHGHLSLCHQGYRQDMDSPLGLPAHSLALQLPVLVVPCVLCRHGEHLPHLSSPSAVKQCPLACGTEGSLSSWQLVLCTVGLPLCQRRKQWDEGVTSGTIVDSLWRWWHFPVASNVPFMDLLSMSPLIWQLCALFCRGFHLKLKWFQWSWRENCAIKDTICTSTSDHLIFMRVS